MKSLVIVESPTKERTISKFLSKDYFVKSSYGHVRDLPQRRLGVDLDHDFEPTYVVLPRAKKMVPEFKKIAKQADVIYLATDYDREGEAIAWHLSEMLNVPDKKIKRITFHEITPEAIKQSLGKPRKIDRNLVDAQVARRVLDRLVGYKLSPLLWKKVKRGLSAGRVQSVAVRMICQREEEISKFVAQEYWSLSVQLDKSGALFWAYLYSHQGKRYDKLDLATKGHVDKVLEDLKQASYGVLKVEAKPRRRQPPAPYTTASLQQDASHRLGFRAQRIMSIAQQLYEGISLGPEGSIGLITYMRTDSTHVAIPAQKEAAAYIQSKYGKNHLPPKTRIFKTKAKGAQEAHEAIRPTSAMRDPASVKQYLSPEQFKLYSLIWERFVASQMADAEYDTVTVDIGTGDLGYVFRAAGRTLSFPGFLALNPQLEDQVEDQPKLPALETGDKLIEKILKPEQHYTEPPPRYNEASLVKAMETLGVGRPSTYAPIIGTILNRGYVRLEDRKFIPTELGKTVDYQLVENFAEIVDINFTAGLELSLDQVADGEADWRSVIKKFWEPFSQKLIRAETDMKVMKPKPQEIDEKCATCGAVMVMRESRYGRFAACSTYPACTYRISIDRAGVLVKPEETEHTCPQCSKKLVVRYGRRGRFLACPGYPECKYTMAIPSDQATTQPRLSGETCENCGKDMQIKRGRFGEFLACTGYPACKTIKKMN
jgi:DNA topoisomerase I